MAGENPFHYNLEILTIVNNEGQTFDIKGMMIECRLYESMNSNFLIGELLVSDALGVLENARLFGQETLTLKFSQAVQVDASQAIHKVFRIFKVARTLRVGQDTHVFRIDFCSPEFIQAKRLRISQAFRGSMTSIATKIAEDNLGIGVETPPTNSVMPYFEEIQMSQGDNYHVIVPNWTINYAINWLCNNAQGVDDVSGLQDSYFFYQTANGGYRINSLARMIEIDYEGGAVFGYSPATVQNRDIPYQLDPSKGAAAYGLGKTTIDYSINSIADTLQGAISGLFASKQITIDNTYKYQTQKTYSYLDKFYGGASNAIEEFPLVRQEPETLYEGMASEGPESPLKIPYATFGAVDSYPDAHTILRSDTHFINDATNNIHQPDHLTHLGSSQFRTAVRGLLEYYSMRVLISAVTDISVGSVITLDIPRPMPGAPSLQPLPVFHSGRYLIKDIDWTLTQRECRTNITVVKDSLMNQIETTVMELPERIEEEI